MYKKLLLGIGSIAPLLMPIIATVSCKTTNKKTNETKEETHTFNLFSDMELSNVEDKIVEQPFKLEGPWYGGWGELALLRDSIIKDIYTYLDPSRLKEYLKEGNEGALSVELMSLKGMFGLENMVTPPNQYIKPNEKGKMRSPQLEIKYKITLNDQSKTCPFYFVELESLKIVNWKKFTARNMIYTYHLEPLPQKRNIEAEKKMLEVKRGVAIKAVEQWIQSHTSNNNASLSKKLLKKIEIYQRKCWSGFMEYLETSVYDLSPKKIYYNYIATRISKVKNKMDNFVKNKGTAYLKARIESLSTNGTEVKFKKTNKEYFDYKTYQKNMDSLIKELKDFYHIHNVDDVKN